MTDSTISVSVVINAPVEQVWSLLIEQQQFNKQELMKQKYMRIEPEGPTITGQVINVKKAFLHVTTWIDHVVQADPPHDGQTIFARIIFLGREGEIVSRWFCDSEHNHIQKQSEVKHPWITITEQVNVRCIAMDTNLCVVVYVQQSETTFRLMPRWLKRLFNNDKTIRSANTKAIEATLQNVKEKSEQHFNHAL